MEGVVVSFFETKYGCQLITIKKDNLTAKLFLEETVNVECGDLVKATGEVQKYDGEWEVIVESKKFLEVIQRWEQKYVPLWRLSSDPRGYEGLNINTTGWIDDVFGKSFYLTDKDRNFSIPVINLVSNLSFHSGEKAIVSGEFIYDKENFRYIIKCYRDQHKVETVEGGVKKNV